MPTPGTLSLPQHTTEQDMISFIQGSMRGLGSIYHFEASQTSHTLVLQERFGVNGLFNAPHTDLAKASPDTAKGSNRLLAQFV